MTSDNHIDIVDTVSFLEVLSQRYKKPVIAAVPERFIYPGHYIAFAHCLKLYEEMLDSGMRDDPNIPLEVRSIDVQTARKALNHIVNQRIILISEEVIH